MSDVVLSNNQPIVDFSPRTFGELMEFATLLANSNLVPKDYIGKKENIVVAVQWGNEIGLKPMQALQNIAVINGRPALWGDSMLAIVLASPLCKDVVEYFEGEGMQRTAVCIAKRNGREDKTQRFSFDDARTAGLLDKQGPWKQYPPRMLQLRARGFALRDQFADVLRGLPMAELVLESTTRDMGPADVVTPELPSHSRTESVKRKMKRTEPVDVEPTAPTLDDVLAAIGRAQTADELSAAGELAAKLRTSEEKDIARTAYADKMASARAAERGDSLFDDGAITYAYVMDRITRATAADDLNDAHDLIRFVPDEQHRKELTEAGHARAVELAGARS
ncbi:hypothetical protein [Burkholderia cenocepacia]|uniref:hypothetical protein n=1 Tax=Burkholderia cenocepacia TaxID=95486 RepID=UPI002B253EFF|nr:hypothetical protein [Burkholderia cenocepacia]MEB2499558.1 hypothetical protein [Burkholderia cenocepacia]MEB2557233.1 hypothetical protein [Burkholderia cenocepacia]